MRKLLKNIVIIPARQGSKRIKNKNIKIFCRKPIIIWTYKILKKLNIFDKIIVSTDSNKIIKVCKSYGMKDFIKRPKSLATDFIGTHEVIQHAIKKIEEKYFIRNICCVYPCSVFINKKDLSQAFKILKENRDNFVLPITKFSHPIQRALKFNYTSKKIRKENRKNYMKRTQDFATYYHDAGQFYLSSVSIWKNPKKKIDKGIVIPKWRAVDTDDLEDWVQAEINFKNLKTKL